MKPCRDFYLNPLQPLFTLPKIVEVKSVNDRFGCLSSPNQTPIDFNHVVGLHQGLHNCPCIQYEHSDFGFIGFWAA